MTHHFYNAKIFMPFFMLAYVVSIYILKISWYFYLLVIPFGFLLYMAIYFIFIFLAIIFYKLFNKKMSIKAIHAMPKGAMRDICFIGRIKVKVHGKENVPKDSGYAIIANHQSMADIFVIMNNFSDPVSFVAKKELGKIPILNFFMKKMGCEFIDRNDIKQSLRAINNATENVKNGYPMLIFPEGTRSKTGDMAEFKQGSLRIATKAKAPILPVTIKNTYKFKSNFPFKRTKVDLIIHKPINFVEYESINSKELPQYINEIVKKGLDL